MMKTGKVLHIAVVKHDGPRPNERIINLLREALRDAKAGKIQGLGMAVACHSDEPDADMHRTTESMISFTDGWAHSTVTAVSALWMRLNYERYAGGIGLPDPELGDDDE